MVLAAGLDRLCPQGSPVTLLLRYIMAQVDVHTGYVEAHEGHVEVHSGQVEVHKAHVEVRKAFVGVRKASQTAGTGATQLASSRKTVKMRIHGLVLLY